METKTINRVKGLMDEEAAACLNPEKWVEGGSRENVVEQFFKPKVKVKAEPKELFKAGDDVVVAGKKLIRAFSRHGIKNVVPFCVHVPAEKEQSFIVQGKQFKWSVIPFKKYKEAVNMPDKEWESLKKLEQSGIKHDGVLVAVPLRSDVGHRVSRELCGMAEKSAGVLVVMAGLPFLAVAPIIAPLDIHDPVLAVRFSGFRQGDLYLEIGRWE